MLPESYNIRWIRLNFIEFNHMLLQAYDFLYLFQQYKLLQMGATIVGAIWWWHRPHPQDRGKTAYSITFCYDHIPGTNGKTGNQKWIQLTSPYEYYQYG